MRFANETPYWLFICNPKKWAIDRFLDAAVAHDTWGVRRFDTARFAPGQLALIRVGVDRRSRKQLAGKPRMIPGIYALCEIESEVFAATGAADAYWADGTAHASGRPTVKIYYLRTYDKNPLTVDRLRAERPKLDRAFFKGHQDASLPISADDFRAVMELLGEDLEALPAAPERAVITPASLANVEKKYKDACPEVQERISQAIERGPIGALVKKANAYKCQLCEALGREPFSFKKINGDPYVEAHHAMPVANKKTGSLGASMIMTLCANHHREMHYGNVEVGVTEKTFDLIINGSPIQIPRLLVT